MATVQKEAHVMIVEMVQQCGSFDDAATKKMTTLLSTCVESAEQPCVVIDLSNARFVGAAFLSLLVRIWKCVNNKGGRLALCHLNPFCFEVLRVVRLNDLFEIYETRQQAMESLVG